MTKKEFRAEKELKYYGVHACLMLAEKRAADIVRVYIDESNVKRFSALLKWCAKNKKAYHIIPSADLNKVSESIHHEGVCILAKELPVISETAFLASVNQLPKNVCLLYLDQVGNPHNVGSILRTAAHFGIPYIIGEDLPALSPSACRIAKGAAELVRIVHLEKGLKTFQTLQKAGFQLISTSSHEGKSLYQFPFPVRTILAIGSESRGVSDVVLKSAAASIQIPGTGAMESLNVSVATALCVGEYYRQHA